MFGKRHNLVMDKLTKIERDQAAAHGAMKNQLGEIHGRINGTLQKLNKFVDGVQKRWKP